MIKRIAALFLVVLLLGGMIPSAFAEEIPSNNISESELASEQLLPDDSEDEYGVMALATVTSPRWNLSCTTKLTTTMLRPL